ncbi:MAG: NAD(P)-dependent oxidoreductase, partial [Planctomycetia bacterium]
MKVLIADKLSEKAVQALQALGLDVTMNPDLSADDLPGAINDTSILVVRSTKVTADTLKNGKQLSLVIRAGAGVNTIDLATASALGVYVANCPGKNTAAVAELAIGHLIAADRRLCEATVALRNGQWKKKEFGKAAGLKGRTLGVLGLGNIGLATAERAKGLGMRVIAWSRSLTPLKAETLGIEYCESPEELAKQADAISVHMAMTPDTKHFVNKSFLSLLKPGTILINTSRGELVDSAALQEAIAEKGLRVGLDVFESEPTAGDAPFDQTELASIVTATPHIGASTNQAAEAIADQTVKIVESFITTGKPLGTVNLCSKSPATSSLVVRHLNKVGVLAGVLTGLREEGINVEEVENTIFEGAKAACCSILLDQPPSDQFLTEIRSDPNIID